MLEWRYGPAHIKTDWSYLLVYLTQREPVVTCSGHFAGLAHVKTDWFYLLMMSLFQREAASTSVDTSLSLHMLNKLILFISHILEPAITSLDVLPFLDKDTG